MMNLKRKRSGAPPLSNGNKKVRPPVVEDMRSDEESDLDATAFTGFGANDDGDLSEDYGVPESLEELGEEDGMDEDDEDEGDSGEEDEEEAEGREGGEEWRSKKPPTGEELRQIKDARELYHSGTFKLQIDELLPNVRPKDSRKVPLERFLHELHAVLMALPSVQPMNPIEAGEKLALGTLGQANQGAEKGKEKKKKKQKAGKGEKGETVGTGAAVGVPWSLPAPSRDAKWKVAFEPPSDVFLAGSWPTGLNVARKGKPAYGVDVCVEMPEALFQEKDYLDGRFFHKKSYYLSVIASLVQDKLGVEAFWNAPLGDPRLTVLVLRPQKGVTKTDLDFSKLNAEVRIIPVLPSSAPIPLHRLSPSHANVRLPSSSSSSEPLTPPPTPRYNAALLLASFPKPHLLATHQLKQVAPAFADAYALLRIWANQRGYTATAGTETGGLCVRGFEGKGAWWASLLGMMVLGEESVEGNGKKGMGRGKRAALGRGLSSYQLFRAALDFLARQPWRQSRAFVKSENGHRFPPEEYVVGDSAVFVDSSSMVNLLADVPIGSLELLSHDAKVTLETLGNSSSSEHSFNESYMKDQNHSHIRFDTVVCVDLKHASPMQSAYKLVDHGSFDNAMLATLDDVLHRGLGDRAKVVTILHPPSTSRPLSEPQAQRLSHVYVGLIFNSENAFRLVDHGPSVEEQETEVTREFRRLWGDKAELRRFKDGRIMESVVWNVKTSDERAHIPAMITRHLVQRHLKLQAEDVHSAHADYDALLRMPQSVLELHGAQAAQAGFKGAQGAFDELVKNMKSLDEELPLALLGVSPISEYLRSTSAFNPLPLPSAASLALPEPVRYFPAMEIVLEFEKSAKWPDDLRAIQKIKLAFFEALAGALMQKVPGTTARVVVGEAGKASGMGLQDEAALEIVTPEGWAFLARIWHDREATLLDRIIEASNMPKALAAVQQTETKPKEAQAAKEAKSLYGRRFIHAPRHHRAVANLCHRFSAYAGTVRLVKRWLASHWLLGSHIEPEAVELLCAKFFVETGSQSGVAENVAVPQSKERGFAIVVQFLMEWNWEEPLFVPLYESAKATSTGSGPQVIALGSKHGVWTIATDTDPSGHMWTTSGPDLIAAGRLRALAKATWTTWTQSDGVEIDVKDLFRHPADNYHLVLHLNPAVLPRYYQNVEANPAVWSRKGGIADEESITGPGFDPAWMLFSDIQRTFADTLKFFYDPLGGDRIGAIWLSSLSEPRPFRALGGFSSAPSESAQEKKSKDLVILNRQAIKDELERMGSGLLLKITSPHRS